MQEHDQSNDHESNRERPEHDRRSLLPWHRQQQDRRHASAATTRLLTTGTIATTSTSAHPAGWN
jgi:hypothetical protein